MRRAKSGRWVVHQDWGRTVEPNWEHIDLDEKVGGPPLTDEVIEDLKKQDIPFSNGYHRFRHKEDTRHG